MTGKGENKKNMRRGNAALQELRKNKVLYGMMLPTIIWTLIFCYIPLLGITIAFKDGTTVSNFFNGDWVGFKNFEFFFMSNDASRIIWNTIKMNVLFIATGQMLSIIVAVCLAEVKSRALVKIHQGSMLFPFFLSAVVIGYLSYAFLSVDKGYINHILALFNIAPVQWFQETKYWTCILVVINLIKSVGYSSLVYYAGIMGIDSELYSAAEIDGAGEGRKVWSITIPLIKPLIIINVIMAIGRIFNSDFGLFYYVPRETGVLFSVTDVIDTYVFRSLRVLGDLSMSAAVGLFQSIVGFVLVMLTNTTVKKIDPDNALF